MTQIKMIRVYETVFEFDTDNATDALKQFYRIPSDERYAVELEQCCLAEEEVLLPGEKTDFEPFEN